MVMFSEVMVVYCGVKRCWGVVMFCDVRLW